MTDTTWTKVEPDFGITTQWKSPLGTIREIEQGENADGVEYSIYDARKPDDVLVSYEVNIFKTFDAAAAALATLA